MTTDHARLRARLASALDDAGEIETRPIEDVRAALAEQGIDPTASIRLAQKLSHGGTTGDPAARLLQQIERSETIDAEIAALEEADIDDIKAALPRQGAEPWQDADRFLRDEERPVEPRRRRLPALGWGGSLIGIAASVLLFIAVHPDRLNEASLSSIEARAPVAADVRSADAASEEASPPAGESARKLLPELSQIQGKASAGSDRYAAGAADLADAREDAPVVGAARRALQSLGEKAAQPLAESRGRDLGEEAEFDRSSDVTASNMGRLQSVPRPVLRPDVEEGERVETAVVTSRAAPLPMAAADVASLSEPPPEPVVLLAILADLKAIFLVDEGRAPTSLRIVANSLPEGGLAAKLGEAERRAADRKVVALVAFARDGEIVEAALVETPAVQPAPDLSVQTVTGFSALIEGEPEMLHRSRAELELIELSADR